MPGWAQPLSFGNPAFETLSGEDITLHIGKGSLPIDGKPAHAVTINGTVPGPLLRSSPRSEPAADRD